MNYSFSHCGTCFVPNPVGWEHILLITNELTMQQHIAVTVALISKHSVV